MNDYMQIILNISLNHVISLNCFSLIDGKKYLVYNDLMAEQVSSYIHTEKSEPVRKVIRNDGVLYLLLLAGAIGCIVLSRILSNRFGTMRLPIQIILYALLLGAGYAVYRFLLVSYRYTLTSEELMVFRTVGSKDTICAAIPLKQIVKAGKWDAQNHALSDGKTYVGRRSESFCVYYQAESGIRVICLSASDHLRNLILESING